MIQLTEAQEAQLQKLVEACFYSSLEEARESESFGGQTKVSPDERAILKERLAESDRGEGIPVSGGKEIMDRIAASDRGERKEFESREEMEAYFNRRIAERKAERANP